MKRWWVPVLVFSLALSLTSCAKKKFTGQVYGWSKCDGSMGAFDVYVIPTQFDSTKYELSVVPVQPDRAGDVAMIAVANSLPDYKPMVNEVVLSNAPIFAGILTNSDLDNYDTVAIIPAQPGLSFLEMSPEKASVCTLPLPGDSLEDASSGFQTGGFNNGGFQDPYSYPQF